MSFLSLLPHLGPKNKPGAVCMWNTLLWEILQGLGLASRFSLSLGYFSGVKFINDYSVLGQKWEMPRSRPSAQALYWAVRGWWCPNGVRGWRRCRVPGLWQPLAGREQSIRGQRNIPVCSARGCLISMLLFTSQQPPCEGAFQLSGSPRSFCSEGLLFGDFTSSLPAAEMSLQCLVLFRGGKTTLLKTTWKKRSLKAERMRLPKMERKLLTNTFWFLSYPFHHPSSFVLLGFLSQDKHRVYFQFTVGRISIHFE